MATYFDLMMIVNPMVSIEELFPVVIQVDTIRVPKMEPQKQKLSWFHEWNDKSPYNKCVIELQEQKKCCKSLWVRLITKNDLISIMYH